MSVWAQALSSAAVIFAVAMRVGERRVVEALEGAGAVDAGTATKLPQENFFQKWHIRRLLNAGVLGETMDQAQYIKLVEYVAYRHRRRKRALSAVVVIAMLGALFYFTAGCTKAVAEGVVRQDSAGVEIVTISAGAIAAAPEWQVDTATHLWSIGGGEEPTQDVDRMISVGRLTNGDVVVGVSRPGELRVYPIRGGAPRVLARGGDGPGEFRTPVLLSVRGDTLLLWDYGLNRSTTLTSDGSVVQVVNHAPQPQHRLREVVGMLDDGRIVMTGQTYAGTADVGSEGVRKEQPIYLLHTDGASADSLPGPPGMLMYKGIVYEGGTSFSSVTTYHLDTGSPVFARGMGYTTSLPGEPEFREYDATGGLHRIVRPGVTRREMTPGFREQYIIHDSLEFVRMNQQFSPDWIRNYREGRFVDRLAAFERIRGGPAGERWFERFWVSYDSVKQFVVFDSTGMVSGRVTIPMSRTIGWIGTDAVLTTWLDADDVRHLSLNPLRRTPPVTAPR